MRAARRRIPLLTALTAALLAASMITTGAAHASAPFYDPPVPLPAGNPGDVIRSEPTDFFLDPAKLLRAPATAHRILYRSTDTHGASVAVSGTVLTPTVPWIGKGERPVVAYTVGTHGVGDDCAPSRRFAAGTSFESPTIAGLLLRGYAVAVTDYQGLGTPGVHTYYNRQAQGHAVLDVLRAAQRLPEAELPEDGPVGTFGYSQGGGASAAAAELAASYAPELTLAGSYAGAVRANQHGMPGGQLGYLVLGLNEAYPELRLMDLFNDNGKRILDEVAETCIGDLRGETAMADTTIMTVSGRALADILAEEPYASAIAAQRIGTVAPASPALVVHSRFDDGIPWELSRDLSREWCARGATVRFSTTLVPTHVLGAIGAYPEAFAWLDARFAGRPAPENCGGF